VGENLAAATVRHLPVEAGWCAVLLLDEGSTAERVLEECGVVVHPGSFYGMAGPGRAVVSLLGPAEDFRRGMRLLGGTKVANTSPDACNV
jgi:aspartate/methionine/tyrosine aminotransferase